MRRSSAHLSRAGIPSPRLEAELLLAHSLGLRRLDLYLQFERPLSTAELDRLRPLLRLRSQACPLAYLTGEREFQGLTFKVGPGVLIPRPETETLVELALARSQGLGPPVRVADLGCGSGCIGISLAVGNPSVSLDAVDISEKAVFFARENVARHRLGDRVAVFQGSWTDPLRGRGPYHLVLSNPPYVTTAECAHLDRTVADYEPRIALEAGDDGLEPYRALLAQVTTITGPGSVLLLEGDPRRMAELSRLCLEFWPGCRLTAHPDLSGRDRVLEVALR